MSKKTQEQTDEKVLNPNPGQANVTNENNPFLDTSDECVYWLQLCTKVDQLTPVSNFNMSGTHTCFKHSSSSICTAAPLPN